MTPPLPATVIGGYLGAGKTTLVNHVLRHANGLRLAVLVNEFGALPIDEDLIEAESDKLISIAGGCICCSFGSDLTAALIDLCAMTPRPDHVLIESSGVAMPGAIAASVGLIEAYAPPSVVVLADTETVQTQAQDEFLGDTTLRQLHDAHLIIQSKTDLVAEPQVQAVAAWLADTNPRAAVVAAAHGRVPASVVLGPGNELPVNPHTAHADALFASEVFAVEPVTDPSALARSLADAELGVVRAKGFVRDRSGQRFLIQNVGARTSLKAVAGEAPSQMVCIGRRDQLDTDALARLFSAKCSAPADGVA